VAVLSDGRIMQDPEEVIYSVVFAMNKVKDAGRPIEEVLQAAEAECKRLRGLMRGTRALTAPRTPVVDHDEDFIPSTRRSPLKW
jgi:hypothetical protein